MKRLRFRKVKKPPEYAPVYINTAEKSTPGKFTTVSLVRLLVKILLTWFAAGGLSVTLAQLYSIPVTLSSVAFVSFGSVVFFQIGLIYYRKRALLIPAGVVLVVILLMRSRVWLSLGMFFNHMMSVLDSRLLSTGGFIQRQYYEYGRYHIENSQETALVFLGICVVIALTFSFETRSRLVGFMFVCTVFMLAPAFAAEIAGYVSGMNLLIAGLIGNYAAWAAHAWENSGGLHQVNYMKQYGNALPPSKPAPEPSKSSLFKLSPGKLPHFYKYSRNSAFAATLALCAVIYAANSIPEAIKFDYMTIVDAVRDMASVPQSVQAFFRKHFGSIEHNGFFPDFSGGDNISMSININNPSSGTTPVIRVMLDNDLEKVYFRGGIGIDFQNQGWSIQQNTHEFRQLVALLESGFTPELEYHTFRQVLQTHERGERWRAQSAIRRQSIEVEYLTRTDFLLIPMNPYDPERVRNNRNYQWHLDTVIRPARRVSRHEFDTIHLVADEIRTFQHFYETWKDSQGWEEEVWRFPCDTTSDEWNRDIAVYRELVSSVYLNVPENEQANIDMLLEHLGFNNAVLTPEGFFTIEFEHGGFNALYDDSVYIEYLAISPMYAVTMIHDFLRANYEWSLDVDNNIPGNTAIGNFLFETRTGHCAMYATAMTLAVRQLGIPARYVTGVVSVSGGGLIQTMAERDFHAWVEVYFENVGWVPFDPTGGARGEDPGLSPPFNPYPPIQPTDPPPPTNPPTPTDPPPTQDTPPAVPTEPDEPGTDYTLILTIIAIVVGVSMAGTAVIITLRRLKKAEAERLERWGTFTDNNTLNLQTAREMYRYIMKMLKKHGFTPTAGEAPLLFAERTIPALTGVMPIFEKLEFAADEMTELTDNEFMSVYEYVNMLKAVKR